MNLYKIRADILLLVIAAYLILNQGAMMIRFPPTSGSGLPIGELIVIIFMFTMAFEVRRAPSFGQVAPLLPLFAFWGLATFQILIGLPEHGFWAVRDASHAIETAFLWIGFVVAASSGFFERFSRWLRVVLNIAVCYALLYPVRDTLTNLSPEIQAAGGYTVPLFFNYFSAGLLPLTAAMRWLVDRVTLFGIPAAILAGVMIIYCAVIFQMRTTYLQIITVFIVMAVIQPRVAIRMSFGMLFGITVLALAQASGIEITGRLGEKFSWDFFTQHFASILGTSGDSILHDAAKGVGQRLRWWTNLWHDISENVQSLLFGLGYGIPLTDFYFTGAVRVREPHNSIISMVARLGFVGLFFFVWFQFALVRVWIRSYRWCVQNGEMLWKNNLLIIGVFFLLLWVHSIGEDAFEKPYNAIAYYFLWGVVLRFYYEILVAQGKFQSSDSGYVSGSRRQVGRWNAYRASSDFAQSRSGRLPKFSREHP